MIDFSGSPRQVLAHGEVKGVASGRVILVPGPAKEINRVKDIYRLTIFDRRSAKWIAREFNRKRMKCCGVPWTGCRILEILSNPKYVGCAAWRRTTGVLGRTRVKVQEEDWTIKRGAFQAIIDQQTFDSAQRVFRDRTQNKSNEQLLQGLKELLAREGRLSEHIIDASRAVPTTATYQRRFGSVRKAYALIGYREFRNLRGGLTMRRRHNKIAKELRRRILRTFPGQVNLIREQNGCRQVLRFADGLKLSVVICQCVKTTFGAPRWNVFVNRFEHCYPTLICRCSVTNEAFKDFHVVPRVDPPSKEPVKTPRKRMFRIKENDPWLTKGKRLTDLSNLWRVAKLFATAEL